MRALATSFNDCPERASRPFDLHREGFILSEGVGVVVLERMDQAVARGATIYAEVLGHASSSDAFHVAAPDPDGDGRWAMRWALGATGLGTEQLDYVNAHGSSTLINDQVETLAIKRLLGEYAYEIAVSSTKSVMGHAMEAPARWRRSSVSTPCMAAAADDQLRDARSRVRPGLRAQRGPAGPHPTAMSNSFGLGGQNACLVLGRVDNGHSPTDGEPAG